MSKVNGNVIMIGNSKYAKTLVGKTVKAKSSAIPEYAFNTNLTSISFMNIGDYDFTQASTCKVLAEFGEYLILARTSDNMMLGWGSSVSSRYTSYTISVNGWFKSSDFTVIGGGN